MQKLSRVRCSLCHRDQASRSRPRHQKTTANNQRASIFCVTLRADAIRFCRKRCASWWCGCSQMRAILLCQVCKEKNGELVCQLGGCRLNIAWTNIMYILHAAFQRCLLNPFLFMMCFVCRKMLELIFYDTCNHNIVKWVRWTLWLFIIIDLIFVNNLKMR